MSAPPKILPTSPARLLVEGTDDKFSIIEFTQRHGLDWELPTPSLPYVHACGSDEQVLADIPAAVNSYARLGIVLDADDAPIARWERIRLILKGKQVEAPEFPKDVGTLIEGSRPRSRIGIWLMPDNRLPGRLEDFLTTLIPTDDKVWPHAQSCSVEAQSLGAAFKPVHLGKAQFRTWLAWQRQPGLPPGKAIQRKALSENSPVALLFLTWFKGLFIEP